MIVEFSGERVWRGSAGAAGYDLVAQEACEIRPGQVAIVPTGLHAAIPEGYCGMVCSRSGLAAKHGVFVLNAPGIIDSDYRGQVQVILMNAGRDEYWVTAGDRIAQLLLVPIASAMWMKGDILPDTERGAGGLGSTGA